MNGGSDEERWGPILVDEIAVVSLVTLSLSLLDESFWSRAYLLAGVFPVVFLVASALVLRRAADGAAWYALLALISYAPLGALVALQRPGPWLVPTFETMTRVLGESVAAPQLFVNTLPPVEASGTLMLVPYALGYLAGAPAAWFAVATRAAVLPLVPVLAGLAATIPLAILVPDHLVLRGLVLGMVCVAWAAARARRREAVVGGSRGVVAGALLSTLVVASVSGLVSVLVPDDDETDRALLAPAADAELSLSRASENVVLPGAGRQVLLRATGVPPTARLRFVSLDLYDGDAWTAAQQSPDADPAGTFRRIGGEAIPLHEGDEVKVRVQIRPSYVSDWLPTVGELTSLDLESTDGRTQLGDVRYNQTTSTALVVGGVHPRDDYVFTAVLTPDGFGGSDKTAPPTDAQLQPDGAFLDQYLRPFEDADATPFRRVLLLARYLRQNGAVRLAGTSSQGAVDLGARLLGSDRISATPFQYSAVMALGASRLGVPARMVVGAEPAPNGTITQGDVVSWVELQLADGTWRTLEPERYVGVHSSVEDDEIDVDVAGWVTAEEQAKRDQNITIPKGADIDLPEGTVIEEQRNPWEVLALVAGCVVGLAALLWASVPVLKVLQRRRRRRAESWSAVYVNGWQELLDVARDRGTPVIETWSRVAQARALGVGLDQARTADAAVFSPVAASTERGREFWNETQLLRAGLLAEVGVRRRMWAVFNPGSLLAGMERRRSTRRSDAARPVRDEDRRAGGQQPAGA
ncbi:MAG: DUF3488 and transglutaminase-like domain-containing protein [Nocardioides sp.]|nr:DUF3488 and transglutaminase-like domain-containing protein [Nocardioides sp.]